MRTLVMGRSQIIDHSQSIFFNEIFSETEVLRGAHIAGTNIKVTRHYLEQLEEYRKNSNAPNVY